MVLSKRAHSAKCNTKNKHGCGILMNVRSLQQQLGSAESHTGETVSTAAIFKYRLQQHLRVLPNNKAQQLSPTPKPACQVQFNDSEHDALVSNVFVSSKE
jgi:hypothetical protein